MAFKIWADGEVVDATEFNDYLQEQVVMVFASTAARDSALTSVKTEGMVTYQSDTDTFTFFDGSTWKDLALGLTAGSITSTQLGTSSVTTAKVADLNITLAKLAADSVDSTKIVASAVGTDEINDNAVTSAKIAAGAVTATEIATDAVGSAEIAADAVGSSEIAANAVGSSEIANNAVGSDQIAADAVGSSEIADDAVGNNQIDGTANFVTTGHWLGSELQVSQGGSDSNVAIGPSGDSNTGMNFPAGDQWRLVAGGDQIVTADGTVSPKKLFLAPDASAPQIWATNLPAQTLGTGGSTAIYVRSSDGWVHTVASLAELKENIEPAGDIIDEVLNIEVVEFDYRDTGDREVGAVHEQVARDAPRFATPNAYDERQILMAALGQIQRLEERITELEEEQKR